VQLHGVEFEPKQSQAEFEVALHACPQQVKCVGGERENAEQREAVVACSVDIAFERMNKKDNL
jgi:hypothetical protein